MDTNRLTAVETSAATMSHSFWSFSTTQALHLAARHALFQLLAQRACNADEIAQRSALDRSTVNRMMWALQSINAVIERGDGYFELTPSGRQLIDDDSPDLTNMSAERFLGSVWSDPLDTSLDDVTGYSPNSSHALYDQFSRSYSDVDLYHSVMAAGSQPVLGNVLQEFDFSNYATIAEIGGGHGDFLHGILGLYPHSRGILYDLPLVIAEAKARWQPAIANRCRFIGVHHFDVLQHSADICLITQVLQSWTDCRLRAVLANCSKVSRRMLLIAQLLPADSAPGDGQASLLESLNLLPAGRRSGETYSMLLEEAGYLPQRIVPVGRYALIEAVAA